MSRHRERERPDPADRDGTVPPLPETGRTHPHAVGEPDVLERRQPDDRAKQIPPFPARTPQPPARRQIRRIPLRFRVRAARPRALHRKRLPDRRDGYRDGTAAQAVQPRAGGILVRCGLVHRQRGPGLRLVRLRRHVDARHDTLPERPTAAFGRSAPARRPFPALVRTRTRQPRIMARAGTPAVVAAYPPTQLGTAGPGQSRGIGMALHARRRHDRAGRDRHLPAGLQPSAQAVLGRQRATRPDRHDGDPPHRRTVYLLGLPAVTLPAAVDRQLRGPGDGASTSKPSRAARRCGAPTTRTAR